MLTIKTLDPWKRPGEQGGNARLNPEGAEFNPALLFTPWGVQIDGCPYDRQYTSAEYIIEQRAKNPDQGPDFWHFFSTKAEAEQWAKTMYAKKYEKLDKTGDFIAFAFIKPIGSKADILAAFARTVNKYGVDLEITPAEVVEAIQAGTKKGAKEK